MDIALHLPRVFLEKPVTERAVRAWEVKTFNRQAVVWETNLSSVAIPNYISDTRQQVKQACRPNILRGLALGTVLNVPRLPPDLSALASAIDARQKSTCVWQWAIVVCEQPKVVVAIHTWMRVQLTDIYESALSEYREEGYQVGNFMKDKDALIKFLTRIARDVVPEME